MSGTTYLDAKGRKLFVAEGIWFAQPGLETGKFGTFYRKGNGRGMHRLVSPALPMRDTIEEAQTDLAVYATKKKMRKLER